MGPKTVLACGGSVAQEAQLEAGIASKGGLTAVRRPEDARGTPKKGRLCDLYPVLVDPKARLAFVGDALFHGSVGRTDFSRGNHADLVRSIKTRLWPLGDDISIVPGHGALSTFGLERRDGPYVGDAT